jgi:hypothetical protein
MSAVVVTLLPVPIAYFAIIPAYQMHATFLLFYVPFLCLLTLCYLFYVRDSLARSMFADVLDPPPPLNPYNREPLGERLRRGFRQLKKIVLGILPVILTIASMYCVSRYLVSLTQSVALASATYLERSAGQEEVGALPEDRDKPRPRRSVPAGPVQSKRSPAARALAGDSLPPPSDSAAIRKYVLRTTAIDDIPRLVELTALYVGAFLALLIAVSLMALKEYAKEAMGLSEHELMFGRYHRTGENE